MLPVILPGVVQRFLTEGTEMRQSQDMYRIIGGDGREYGPVSAEQLRQWVAEGRANAETRVVVEGTTDWKPLGSFPEFSSLFAPPSSPEPARPPVTTSPVSPARQTNSLATASLVLGIVAITVGWCCCYGLPFNVLGLVFGLIALSQINQNPLQYDGKGLAIAGLILSGISLLLAILLFVFFGAINVFSNMGPGGHRMYRL